MSYAELTNKPINKTRFDHRCEWCDHRIDRGSKARYRSYVYDGDFNSAWMHPDCYSAYNIVSRVNGYNIEWFPGDYERGGTEFIN